MTIPVEFVGEVDPVALFFRLYLSEPPTHDQKERLIDRLVAWYDAGSRGEYGSPFHFMSDVEFPTEESRVDWWADLGGAGQESIQGVVDFLTPLQEEEHIPITRLEVGWVEEA